MTGRERVFLTGHRGASTLAKYMRRKAVHIVAAIAESLRFFAVVFLAFSVGALLDSSVANLLRYAAAPQLLFAAGFFFMWLDPARYSSYRPLLLIGKAASAVCFLPLAGAVIRDSGAMGSTFGVPYLGLVLAFLLAVVDLSSLFILTLGSEPGSSSGHPSSTRPDIGQSLADIESVEGL
jgi:hypothetical protein